MKLKEIVTVSGKGGLFKVVKPTRTGMILESLDKQQVRLIVGPNHRLSLLSEISIYTSSADGSTPLQEVLYTLQSSYGKKSLPVSGKSEPDELAAFMEKAVPEYDRDRVYASDIKKLVNWYGILQEYAPEILEKPADKPAATEAKTPAVEEKPKKAKKSETSSAEAASSAEAVAKESKKPAAKKKQKNEA